MTRGGRTLLASLGLVVIASACAPNQLRDPIAARPQATAEPLSEEPPLGRSQSQSSANQAVSPSTVERPPSARPSIVDAPLCAEEGAYCGAVSQGEAALFRALGRAPGPEQRALRDQVRAHVLQAEALQPERPEHRMLEARERLFDGSLAFGAGGERARVARDILSSIWERHHEPARLLLELARVELALGDTERLSSRIPLLLKLLPEDPEVQALSGLLALAQGKPREALPWLERAAKWDETRSERHLVLGTAEMLLGELGRSERSFRRAIQLDASSAEAHGNLGTVLVLLGRVSEGRAHLERATVISPRRATFVSNLAYAEFVEGRLDRAKELAQRALSIDEKLVSAWVNLALVEAKLGRISEARSALLRAKSLDPEDPRVLSNLADLDALSPKAQGSREP